MGTLGDKKPQRQSVVEVLVRAGGKRYVLKYL